MRNKTAIIIGASSGLGRSLSIELAKSAVKKIIICSSDIRDLIPLKKHIEVLYNIDVICSEQKYGLDKDAVSKTVKLIKDLKVNLIYFPIGYSCEDNLANMSSKMSQYIMDVNYFCILQICSALHKMALKKQMLFVGFGSIAASRGRSNNVIYSSSKRALKSFFESLMHSLRKVDSYVQFYDLGYLNTSLAEGKTKIFRPADIDTIARTIVSNINKKDITMYLPSYWFIVVTIIRLIPNYLFKKINF